MDSSQIILLGINLDWKFLCLVREQIYPHILLSIIIFDQLKSPLTINWIMRIIFKRTCIEMNESRNKRDVTSNQSPLRNLIVFAFTGIDIHIFLYSCGYWRLSRIDHYRLSTIIVSWLTHINLYLPAIAIYRRASKINITGNGNVTAGKNYR